MDTVISILNSTLRLTTPIAYVTLGAVVLEKSGLNALSMEGVMLSGAFGAVLGSWATGSAWFGVLAAMGCAILVSLLRSYLAIAHQANQTVSGVGLNILAGGATAMLVKVIWGMDGRSDQVVALGDWTIPYVADIPVVGKLLGQQNPLVYLLVPIALWMILLLNKTAFGLRVAAAGEHPEVLSSLGLRVSRYRYLSTILSGALSGLGGAYLSIGQLSFFNQDMTSGRGFMALAACVFGGWRVGGALAGSLLFGFANALQLRLQTTVRYTQFVQMIPYVVTLVVLSGFIKRANAAPAAGGKPYQEQE
ncbi:MAG: ABC transporter permease [Lachnospiraceae bacterium]|jgi:simple sugar transport system permease protein|nr:ABC transporter permease [Lachnospiraceae bacterium]